MIKGNEGKPHVEGRRVNRVSSAVWPVKVRKVVATGKAAQRRRDWIIQGRWWIIRVSSQTMRVLLIPTTLLVVVSSLLVAFLGLHFWYLLLFPLLLFAALLTLPAFLARRMPAETLSLSPFGQETRSSTGIISLEAQALKSQSGTLSVKRNPGILSSEAPLTPILDDQPLVRVLETYDLRPNERFSTPMSGEETDGYPLMYSNENDFWAYIARTNPQGTNGLSCENLADQGWDAQEMPTPEILKSEQKEL
jgi:hypothetical protein